MIKKSILTSLAASGLIAAMAVFTPVMAANISAGNAIVDRANVDVLQNFTVVDTNNPITSPATLDTFSYFATTTDATTSPINFVVVDENNVVKWVSPDIIATTTGPNTWMPASPVQVYAGWNIAVHFGATSTIPFDATGTPAVWTANGSGLPTVGTTLPVVASSTRVYSFSATGQSTDRATTTIASTPSPGGPIGTVLNDNAHVSGGVNPTGSVLFKLYSPSDATCSGAPAYFQTVALTGLSATTSPGFASDAAGMWHWTAVYSGDVNNQPATSTCQSEVVTIGQNSPTISTTLSTTSAMVGTSVHDSATISGATASSSGSVAYNAYTNNTCSAGAMSLGTKTVTNGIVPDSDAMLFNSAGTFYFQAVYSGDGNNSAATSTCQDEVMVISSTTPPAPVLTSIVVSPTNPSIMVGDTQQFTAQAFDQFANPIATTTFTWSVDNGVVASISGSGLATGLASGTTVVKAQIGSVFGTTTLMVTPLPPPPPGPPTDKGQCKKGGWMNFTNPSFKNQGQCVSYTNHH